MGDSRLLRNVRNKVKLDRNAQLWKKWVVSLTVTLKQI